MPVARSKRHIIRENTNRLAYLLLHMNIKKKDVQVFLICLAGAFTLWLFNVLNRERTEEISYPIQFVYDHNEYIALEPLPRSVTISVKGTGWQIMKKMLRIRVEPITYKFSSRIQKPYLLGSELKRRVSVLLDGVVIQDVTTDTIPVGLDPIQVKSFPLKMNMASVRLEEGYRVKGAIFMQPDRLTLTGPQRYISKLSDTLLIALKRPPLNRDFKSKIDLNNLIPSQAKEFVQQSTDAVWVRFDIGEFTSQSAKVPIELRNFPKNLLDGLQKPWTDITYIFDKKHLAQVDLSDFKITADFQDFRLSDSTISLNISKRPDFILMKDIKVPDRITLEPNE